MRVIWVTKVIPTAADAGDRVYSVNLARALAEAGAKVWALGLDDGGAQGVVIDHPNLEWIRVPAKPPHSLIALLRPLPMVTEKHSPTLMRSRFEALCAEINPDAVVIDTHAAGWVLPYVAKMCPQCLVVYVAHNHEASVARAITSVFSGNVARRGLLKLNEMKIEKLESLVAARADLLVAITEADKQQFSAVHDNIVVIPPGYGGPRRNERTIDASVDRVALILGSVRWIAKQMNMESFLKVADKRLAENGIKVIVVGDTDETFLARWYGKLSSFTFAGFVPDLTRTMDNVRMGLIVEATGGGFKLKVLDYIFNRIPVLALEGSAVGLSNSVNAHIQTAAGMEDLVAEIIRLCDDFDALNALQNGAYEAAKREFDWSEKGLTLFKAIEERAAHGKGGR